MWQWSEQQEMVRTMMRRFVEAELVPHLEAIEHGGEPPYAIMRRLVATFGIADLARARFEKLRKHHAEAEAAGARGEVLPPKNARAHHDDGGEMAALQVIPIIELSRYSPGLVTAMGVSMGLTANAILSRGTFRQKERWGLPLSTLETIGAWAITEPGSGSDAFGAMQSTARPDPANEGGYLLNGAKTFITNGPYADTILFICKLDRGETTPEEKKGRKVVSFILDQGMPGLVQSKPLRKMGMHSSPTGELFLSDVQVGRERLLGEREEAGARDDAKATFGAERSGVLGMALGMIERAQELSLAYARERVQFGKPIGEFQLIQLKIARMEVARQNVQNLLFRTLEMGAAGKRPSLAEASAGKLYAAQACMEVCLEAVQIHGGNGYMAEYHVEQLARDAKVLQIYGGTDEIQVSQIARDLLSRAAR